MAGPHEIPPEKRLPTLQILVDNGLYDKANEYIKAWGYKIEIRDGKLLDNSDTTEAWLRKFVTIAPTMLSLKDKVRKLAKVEDEVLIRGETGTGKEIVAHALHGDRNGRFIGVNCAGIPEHLVESLLFGHMRGSFTGATDTKQGYMQLAKDGTLFLDEVGELPLSTQAKFLRAIQERRIMKVGGDKDEDISCKIVCATHRDLVKMVGAEQFRQDLYARISTFDLFIEPLSKRTQDVQPILESLTGGPELLDALRTRGNRIDSMKIPLNVRTLQQWTKRYRVLGELPL